jgi:hypothetical protein
MVGSRAYGVEVAKSEFEKALRLLQDDARLRPYMYIWVRGVKGELGPLDPKTWPVRLFDLTLAQIAESPVFKQDGNLRRLAKETIDEALSVHPKRARELKPLAVVHEMRLLQMRYIADDKKVHTGYKAEVTLKFKRHPSMYWNCLLYVWDDGRHADIRGGSGSD